MGVYYCNGVNAKNPQLAHMLQLGLKPSGTVMEGQPDPKASGLVLD